MAWFSGDNKRRRAERVRRAFDLPTTANLGGRRLYGERSRQTKRGDRVVLATTWRDEQA